MAHGLAWRLYWNFRFILHGPNISESVWERFVLGFLFSGGATYLMLAVISRIWLLLGWAIPLLAYGLFATLLPGKEIWGIPLGIMFITVALSCSIIQVWQIRKIESQHESR